jgi:hypothetical protein
LVSNSLKRTRKKYQTGSRYNDTPIDRHQYYLIPPRLQEKDRLWKCVHFMPGTNDQLFEPYLMRAEQEIAGLERRGRRLEELAKIPEEEMEKRYQVIEDKILQHHTKKEVEKHKKRELEKPTPSEFDTKLDSY